MAEVLVIDSETPGFAKPMRPLEIATILLTGEDPGSVTVSSRTYQRFRCPAEMFELGAMAVHNILPEDVAKYGEWNQLRFAQDHIFGVDYLVGHNVDFDWEVIGKPDVKRIDTLALSYYYWPDLDAHKLGAMMYHLFGATCETRQELLEAHSAEADAQNCLRVLGRIVEAKGIHSWAELYKVSELGRIPYRMRFGKYGPKDGQKGMIIAEMVKRDPGYVKWMKQNMTDLDPYLRKALDNPRQIVSGG